MVYTKMRQGTFLLNRGAVARLTFDYEVSLQNINESRKYLLNLKENDVLVYEQLFLTNYC